MTGAVPVPHGRGRTVRGTAPELGAWPDEPLRVFVGRTWGGCAALGTGLLLVGLASEHLGAHTVVAAPLLGLAAGAFVAAVAALRGGGRLLRGVTVLLAVAGASAAAAGLLTHRFGTAELAALTLGTTGAVLLASASRTVTTDDASAGGARRSDGVARLALLAVGALAVAAAVGQGLAATEAGDHAVPHGWHGGH